MRRLYKNQTPRLTGRVKKEYHSRETVSKKKHSNKKKTLVIIAAVFVVAGILIGRAGHIFGRSQLVFLVNFLKNGRQNTGTKSENGKAAPTPQGEFLVEEKKLPESFPKDFPVYPVSDLINSWTASGNETKGLSVVWETQDSVSQVSKFYKEELPNAKWTISSSYQLDDSSTFSFEKENISGFVGVTKGKEGRTAISVTIGVRQ